MKTPAKSKHETKEEADCSCGKPVKDVGMKKPAAAPAWAKKAIKR